MSEDFLQFISGRDPLVGCGFRLEFGVEDGLLDAPMGADGFSFAEARQSADEAEVELGSGAELGGKDVGIEGKQELVELSGHYGAAGILGRGAGLAFQEVEGGFAGGGESLLALEFELEIFVTATSPASEMALVEVFAVVAEV